MRQKPVHLLFAGHVAVVELNCICRLAKWRNLARGVDSVAFHHIIVNLVIAYILTFLLHLFESAAGTFLGACTHKYFQFGVWKHCCADVSSVHHDSLVFPKFF